MGLAKGWGTETKVDAAVTLPGKVRKLNRMCNDIKKFKEIEGSCNEGRYKVH